MSAWFELKGIENVKPLADGNGEFTHKIGAECKKSNVGFGYRSWRYAVVLNDGLVESVSLKKDLKITLSPTLTKYQHPKTY